jgi:hypothetical protein
MFYGHFSEFLRCQLKLYEGCGRHCDYISISLINYDSDIDSGERRGMQIRPWRG